MRQFEKNSSFEDQMARISEITGKIGQIELSECMGIRQSAFSDARRRGRIPESWLATLLRERNIRPEWILTGRGMRFARVERDSHTIAVLDGNTEALRGFTSRTLADELLRRVVAFRGEADDAIAPAKSYLNILCSDETVLRAD